MAYHPINLVVRFLLELLALGVFATVGWRLTEHGLLRVGLAILLPVLAATLWGVFAVPDDPSRSGAAPVAISGGLRLALELAFFAAAACALSARNLWWGAALTGVVVIHYAVSWERIQWLLER